MNTLLFAKGTVTPNGSKSHITYQFQIYKEVRKLHVDFSYEPRLLNDKRKSKYLIEEALQKYVSEEQLESYTDHWETNLPLKNLMTLSFDDANGFRGAAHRYGDPDEHLVITADEASPGFIAGTIPCGLFKLTISVHCIITEECHYTLSITDEGD